MTKAQIEAYDQGFADATLCRAKIALEIGEVELDEEVAEALSAECERLREQVAEYGATIDRLASESSQMTAGFVPAPPLRQLIATAFLAGSCLGIVAGAFLITLARRLWS